jgi:exopolyphosphatase / guanosine-5'-triphosphate,3'-diphosphate pyrophosphatase
VEPRFAAIDVGSNALRLRVVEAAGPGAWREIASARAAVRLGREVFVTGRLSGGALADASRALRAFRDKMDREGVVAYRAVATSAVRDARNGAELIERARRESGIHLEAIGGAEEARIVELAVTRHARLSGRALLVDVGGGSTELTLLDGGTSAFRASLPLGTVRLLETSLGPRAYDGGVDARTHERVCEAIARAMSAVPLDEARGALLVGTGGNADTLAQLCPGAAGARSIDVASARDLLDTLVAMTPAARIRAYGLRPDRADTIVPASAIFLHVAAALGAREIAAPGVGVKEGVLHELIERYFRGSPARAPAVLGACRRLGRRLQWDEAHAEKVAALSASLFDDLVSVHGLGDRERMLLQAAALLHDVGNVVRRSGHHKHGYHLIMNSEILGLTSAERAIVANVARYHRKRVPDVAHAGFRALDRDARAKVRALAAILRVADALDREHEGVVSAARAVASRDRVRLALTRCVDRELDERAVVAKAGLFREVFGRELVVVSAGGRAARAA